MPATGSRKESVIALAALVTLLVSANGLAAVHQMPSAASVTLQTIELLSGQKSFLCADVDSDGHMDLLVAEASHNRIVVYLNDANGRLKHAAQYPAGERPTWLAALDINDDDTIDVAVANHEANVITLLQGGESATFKAAATSPIKIATQPHSHAIEVADFNGDGFADLVVDNRDQRSLAVLLGHANGGFDAPGHNVAVGGAPYLGFALSDLNQDGKPDVITPNQNDIGVLLNRSSDALAFERMESILIESPFAVAAGDLNGDKDIDIVVASEGQTPSVTLFAGDGTGHFEHSGSAPMAQGAKLLATGDINADAIADAVVTSWNGEIVLLIGGRDTQLSVSIPTRGIRNPWGLALADFDNDGRDEIIVGDASSGRIHIYSVMQSKVNVD